MFINSTPFYAVYKLIFPIYVKNPANFKYIVYKNTFLLKPLKRELLIW